MIPCLNIFSNIFAQAIKEIFDYAIYNEFFNNKNITMHDQLLRKLSVKDNMMSEYLVVQNDSISNTFGIPIDLFIHNVNRCQHI